MKKLKNISLTIEGKKISISFQNHFANLVKVNESLNKGSNASYTKRGYTYVDVPEIVGITGACENVDTLFKVGNRLDLPLFFSQTGQLSLEQALQTFPAVWTVIHSGRDEEEEDERHLRQFRLTEEEFDSTTLGMTRSNYNEDKMYEALLTNIQKTIQGMVGKILQDNKAVLKKVYKRSIAKLEYATTHNFLRISYEDAVILLNKNGYPNVHYGDDLKADHEAKIVELLNKKGKTELPVFIMKYPKEIKFFNMKVSEKDDRVCLSADLIFPYAGEGTGSAVREHNFERLNERLLTSNMYRLHKMRGGKYEDFAWYLEIMKNKWTNPHAGYGIGNDRVLQYVFGEKDIRHTSLFSLLNTQTGDWETKHYGEGTIVAAEGKKHVLLSIGKVEDKQSLLPFIKSVSKKTSVVLYATENTHKFLASKGIITSHVYKISQVDKTPNIGDLLARKIFDIVINIPSKTTAKSNELTDGQLIRKGAVELGINPITDIEVAENVLTNLAKN